MCVYIYIDIYVYLYRYVFLTIYIYHTAYVLIKTLHSNTLYSNIKDNIFVVFLLYIIISLDNTCLYMYIYTMVCIYVTANLRNLIFPGIPREYHKIFPNLT